MSAAHYTGEFRSCNHLAALIGCPSLLASSARCLSSHSGLDTTSCHRSAVSAQAATEVRKEVNKLDNQTTGKAIDALLNFETVALFNNQVLQYHWKQ